MAGMSVSEYIRRRRLSQAVFDIQNSRERIIDIALKYGYESQATFSRAFKELHNTTPLSARKSGIQLKTYPPISFRLTIKGAEELNFRIENRPAFEMVDWGIVLTGSHDQGGLPSFWSDAEGFEAFRPKGSIPEKDIIDLEEYNEAILGESKPMIKIAWKGEQALYYFVCAYEYESKDGKTKAYCELTTDINTAGLHSQRGNLQIIPATDWVVFPFAYKLCSENVSEAYARILTEWFPASNYTRNKAIPHLEQFPVGIGAENMPWEIWMPIM